MAEVVRGQDVVCGGLSLVDAVFFLRPSKCPMVVASSEGGYFLNVVSVRPGNSGRYCLMMADSSVVRAGNQRAAW